MKIEAHEQNGIRIAELISDNIILTNAQDALNLLGSMYYEGYDAILIYAKNITPAFFDLKTGIAGEVLQKFSNYRMKLAVVGDFTQYAGNSLRDFIFESNKAGHTIFVKEREEAFAIWYKIL